MDALKAEIAVKRKALAVPAAEGARPTKYMRRGDLERLKEEQEKKEREEKEARLREEREREEREREERRREKAAAKVSVACAHTPLPFVSFISVENRLVVHADLQTPHTQRAALRPARPHPTPRRRSTSPTRRPFGASVQRASPFDSLPSPTRTAD